MVGRLKFLQIESIVEPGKYADGDGLYLVVNGPTARNWSYRYWFKGKERWHGLGSLNDVSLKEARIKRDDARQRVRAGTDVVQEKRTVREQIKSAELAASAPTFRQCAERYISEHWESWSPKHRAQWPSSLQRYAYGTIGDLKVADIRPSHIFDLLQSIWIQKPETANRVRGRIETIIAKNVDLDDLEFRNPAALTKQLREKLPTRPKRTHRHHPALAYSELSAFYKVLKNSNGIAAAALRFLILTGARTNEVLGARWSEIDTPSCVWRIPGHRMKMREDHSVPLSDAALEVLDLMRCGQQCDLIFPNSNGDELSDMAMLAVLKRLGYRRTTVHGFRATFATWAEECTDYPDGVREAALAHKYKDETIAAYQRGGKLEKRRELMADWAYFATQNQVAKRSAA